MSSGAISTLNSSSNTLTRVTEARESQLPTDAGEAVRISRSLNSGNTAAKHLASRACVSFISKLAFDNHLVEKGGTDGLERGRREGDGRRRRLLEHAAEKRRQRAVARGLEVVERDAVGSEFLEHGLEALMLDAPGERAAAHYPHVDANLRTIEPA